MLCIEHNNHTTNFSQFLCNLEDRNETTRDCDLNWVSPCLRAIWESLQLFSSKHSELLFKHAEFCTNFSDLLTKRCRQAAKHFFVKKCCFCMKTVKQCLYPKTELETGKRFVQFQFFLTTVFQTKPRCYA